MDRIIVEELLRSLSVFFITFVIVVLLVAEFRLTFLPLYVAYVIPLIVGGVVFSVFVYKRRTTGNDYRLTRGSMPYRMMMVGFALVGFILVLTGVGQVVHGNTLAGLFSTGLGILGVVGGLREFTRAG